MADSKHAGMHRYILYGWIEIFYISTKLKFAQWYASNSNSCCHLYSPVWQQNSFICQTMIPDIIYVGSNKITASRNSIQKMSMPVWQNHRKCKNNATKKEKAWMSNLISDLITRGSLHQPKFSRDSSEYRWQLRLSRPFYLSFFTQRSMHKDKKTFSYHITYGKPLIMPNLILYNMNIWASMKNSAKKSNDIPSSGLRFPR